MFWAHHERVLRAAYRVTGNLADAEDVAQAVFLRLAGNQQPIDHVESYLYRAAVNGALDLLRRRKLAAELPLDGVAEVGSGRAGSPERAAAGSEVRRWLRSAIGQLSPREAEIFVLRYLEEHDNREIARMVGISRAAVAVILYQARAKLKESYRRFQRGK
jgi:RNA polymerase sigma factor (sigma-70 family)